MAARSFGAGDSLSQSITPVAYGDEEPLLPEMLLELALQTTHAHLQPRIVIGIAPKPDDDPFLTHHPFPASHQLIQDQGFKMGQAHFTTLRFQGVGVRTQRPRRLFESHRLLTTALMT